MVHSFYVFRISLSYTFYYTVKSSYEEQNLHKGVSKLVKRN